MIYFYNIPFTLRLLLQIFILLGITIEIYLIVSHVFFQRGRKGTYQALLEFGILYYFIIFNLSLGLIQITAPQNLLVSPYPAWRMVGIVGPILGIPVLFTEHKFKDLLAVFCLVGTLPFWEDWLEASYAGICVMLTVLLLLRAIYELIYNYELMKTNLSRFSMKQAFDTFPGGLAIGKEHGTVLLINHKMREVMAQLGLTPDRRISGIRKAFRRVLKDQELQARHSEEAGYTLTRLMETQELKLSDKEDDFRSFTCDGRVYSYKEDLFHIGKQAYWQISLTDISEESDLIQKISQKNQELQGNNLQLQEMLQHIEDIQMDKETLRMRNRIHDVMGQRLSILHSSLQQMDRNEEIPLDELIQLLEDMMKDLNEPESLNPDQRFQNIKKTAEIVGTDLVKEGTIPTQAEVAEVMLQILREAVTNAIRHGQAEQVTANFREDADHYYLEILNSGHVPEAKIVEGEGIKGMRHKLAALAGTMDIESQGHFTIKITIPKL